MSKTTIQWCDEVLNPARGCTAVSPGCLNCYAARTATRFAKPGEAFAGLARLKDQPSDANGRKRPKLAVWSGEVTLIPKALHEPLHWSPKHPKRVFVGSVTDMFHESIPFGYIAALFAVMAATPWVTYQLVTKRARRMAAWFHWVDSRPTEGLVHGPPPMAHPFKPLCDGAELYGVPVDFGRLHDLRGGGPAPWPLPNVHLLTSTENQETFDERVPYLLGCPAVVHGVSAEPLLGPIDMGWALSPTHAKAHVQALIVHPHQMEPLPFYAHLRWVITGGESGPGARACDAAWIRDLHRQVMLRPPGEAAFFPKQLGSLAYDDDHGIVGARLPLTSEAAKDVRRLKDGHGGDETEWAHDLQGLRTFPTPGPLSPAQRRHLGMT